ncbi:MAG TPA: glycerol-3-phosphate 1-O-acyltransferase PlsY [Candidatus Binatia bacterium]|jgi:glycerol-3-phosphate acyltransferase PlsY|nr:glycerol-3-phosphate 1-O-acyltransferase PlsY [Candidatus Binatia bacterium]
MPEAHLFPLFLAVGSAYLCGSMPTGVLIARRLGVEVRKVGSGNIGATNVARSAGKKAGLLTLLGDAGKGLLPVLLVRFLDWGETTLAATAVAALLGHLFSPFLGFSGGKGVATGLGVFLGLAPYTIVLAFFLFLATFALSRIVSLSSLTAAAAMPLLLLLLAYPRAYVVAGLVIALLVILRHHENITRLWRGQEPKFSLGKSSSPAA